MINQCGQLGNKHRQHRLSQSGNPQLRGKTLGRRVLIPENTLRAGEDYFLDDMTRTQLAETLQSDVQIVKSSGYDFVEKLSTEFILR